MFKIFLFTSFIMNSFVWQSIEKNKMTFKWKMEGDYLLCEAISPEKGWVAIAFNEIPGIVGSNLIMGAAEKGFFKMSDRSVVRFGVHESVLSLGVNEATSQRNVTENKSGTTMKFRIKRSCKDNIHKDLEAGKDIYVWLAYSESDDFDHHSIMRTSIKINL